MLGKHADGEQQIVGFRVSGKQHPRLSVITSWNAPAVGEWFGDAPFATANLERIEYRFDVCSSKVCRGTTNFIVAILMSFELFYVPIFNFHYSYM